MSTEEAFLHAIQDHPDDVATRLAYADWLEERGDLRAEYIRLCLQTGYPRAKLSDGNRDPVQRLTTDQTEAGPAARPAQRL
jgi:uncharacterized protein (TIGR02996 family)